MYSIGKLISIISFLLLFGCSNKTLDETVKKNKVESMNIVSSLHDNLIDFEDKDSVKWNMYNGLNIEFTKVYSINNNQDSLEFFAVKKDKNFCVYFSDGKYYVFKLFETIPFDSAYVQIE